MLPMILIINTLYFFLFLNYYLFKFSSSYFKKILNIFISFFYFSQYITTFIIRLYSFYMFFLYVYLIKEKFMGLKIYLVNKGKSSYIDNNVIKKTQRGKYFFKLLKYYYKRKMYYGFSALYIQIFLRKIKDKKNNILFFFESKLKKWYNNLVKKMIYYSLFLYIYNNYNLILFLDNLKKKIFVIVFFMSFFELYYILNLKYLINKVFYKNKKKEY